MMRNLLWVSAAGLTGLVIYRNMARRSQKTPQLITSKRGDSRMAPKNVNDFRVTSPAFDPGEHIPAIYSGEADDKSPPLRIEGTPEGTVSLAIIMEDLDSPLPPVFDHWLVWNIPGDTVEIPEGRLPRGAVQGKNTLKNTHYNGPCTPNGTHHYHFKVFALDTMIDLPKGATKKQLKAAMKGHILAQSDLIGLYTANRTTLGNLSVAMLKAASKV